MALDNVMRIPAPDASEFYARFVLKQLAVVFADLFDGSPQRELESLTAVSDHFGATLVRLRPNYMDKLVGSNPRVSSVPPRNGLVRLAEYLKSIQSSRLSDICVEHPTPRELLEAFPLPQSYSAVQDANDIYSNMFIAPSGNAAHLHFDADHRDVLMYQVFGTKRVVVIHPRHTQKLDPIHSDVLCRTSAIVLETATEEQKTSFLRYTDAQDVVLRPGETIFMPAMTWHYLEYLEPSMSIAYRLGRNPYRRRLAQMFPRPSVDVQALSMLLVDQLEAVRHASWLDKLEAAASSALGSTRRETELEGLCLDIRSTLGNMEPVYTIREYERRRSIREARDSG